jgi:hypothetical protein
MKVNTTITLEIEGMRAEFEKWYRQDKVGFEESMLAYFEDHYVNDMTQSAWCGFWCGVKYVAQVVNSQNGLVYA